MAKTLNEFLAIANFLGDDMTDEQASQLMSDAKRELSIAEMEVFMVNVESGSMYYELSVYDAEMGGLGRY